MTEQTVEHTWTDPDACLADLVAMHERWPNIRGEIDLAIVGLVAGGWSQVQIATEFDVLGQEISRRVNRCADCVPRDVDVTDDPSHLWALYTEAMTVPARMDAAMAFLVDNGWRFHQVGDALGISKQMVSKRVQRHRNRDVES